MATYGFLDMFLGFSLFAITTCAVVSLIFYWTPLFQEVRTHCHYGIPHPKHARLLWLVSLTIATWFLAVVTYSRDVSAVWNMMKVSQREGGERAFAFTITQTYFFVLLICGVLAFMFTGWFSYHNRREFLSLVKIIRFHAVRSDSDNDLENGRNDQWEMDTAHSDEDDQAGSGDSDTTTEDEYDPNDGYYLCNEDHRHGWTCPKNYGDLDWNRCGNERKDEDDWPAYVEVVDNEGKGDNVPEEDDPAGSDSDATGTEASVDPHDWSRIYNDLHSCSGFHDEGEDQHDWCRSTNEGDALRLTPSSSGSDAEVNTSIARPPAFDNWYTAPDDTESCSSCDSDYTKTIPWTRPAAHREPLTPTSPAAPLAPFTSDADADAEDTDVDTAFSPPDLPARDPREANILADETGHGQGPPVGEFRHGITRPLRLIIPTESFGSAEHRAPTTPVNTHSLAEWPSSAYVRHSCWRDV